MSEKNKTQSNQLAAALLLLKADVTARDRKSAQEKFNMSRTTISQYLNGEVRDNDTAVSLLTHFRSCISERAEVING